MAKTKNIKEIYESLPESMRLELTSCIVIEGRVTYTTAWRYVTGQMEPPYLYRKFIAEKLSALTGKTFSADQMWQI